MLLEYLKPGSLSKLAGSGEAMDAYYVRHLVGSQKSEDHMVHTRILSDFGVESEWRYDLSYADIDAALSHGTPTAIGVAHKGSIASPAGGHIVLVRGSGYNSEGAPGYYVNDPWGAGFDYTSENGRDVFYPKRPSLDRRWLLDGPSEGWGRIILGVS
jgi:hypothetical protein